MTCWKATMKHRQIELLIISSLLFLLLVLLEEVLK